MKKILFITLLCLPLFAWASDKTKVKFFKGEVKVDLKAIKNTAAAEDKLFFLDFTAQWCSPCKWMEEHTFSDPALAEYISKNYVPVKVDIDDFDGFELKNKYEVDVLPTIIIFNSAGKVIAKHGESLGPTKLLEILKKHNIPKNKLTRQPLPPTTSPEVTKPTPPIKPGGTKVTYAPGTGLFKMDISRKVNTGFSVQVTALQQYDNVMKHLEELKDVYKKPVLLHVETIKGKPTYKILVGEFKTKAEAEKFKAAKEIKGMVKDLSSLK